MFYLNVSQLMTPVVNLKSKKLQTSEEVIVSKSTDLKPIIKTQPLVPSLENIKTDDWDFVDEYDPSWPNEYEKLKEKRNSLKDKGRDERDRGENNGGRRNRDDRCSDRERKRNRRNSRNRESSPVKFSGFGQRITDEDSYSPPPSGSGANKQGGVAIAPPPSLQEISIANDGGDPSSNVTIPYSASSVAAKIMAKYGFKDGQGLGKQEQGMSMALQVEKTSKRGGRIIHERDVFLPPPMPPAAGSGSPVASSPIANMAPPPAQPATVGPTTNTLSEPNNSNPSITEIMKAPSKVVLLRVSYFYVLLLNGALSNRICDDIKHKKESPLASNTSLYYIHICTGALEAIFLNNMPLIGCMLQTSMRIICNKYISPFHFIPNV